MLGSNNNQNLNQSWPNNNSGNSGNINSQQTHSGMSPGGYQQHNYDQSDSHTNSVSAAPFYVPPLEKGACLIGGATLMFTSLLYMIQITMLWQHFFKYLAFWYLCGMGAVIVTMHGSWAPQLRDSLVKNCYFITTRTGRGHLFAFLGTMLIALDSWLPNVISGLYLLSLAVFSMAVSIKNRQEFNAHEAQNPYGQM